MMRLPKNNNLESQLASKAFTTDSNIRLTFLDRFFNWILSNRKEFIFFVYYYYSVTFIYLYKPIS